MLRDRRERGLHVAASGHDHRGQPVSAPDPRGAAMAAQHRIHPLDQMRLIQRLGQHPTHPGRVRQRTQQHIRGATPRGLATLEPIPLHLLPARMIDLDRVPTRHPRTGLAVRTQPSLAQLPGEADVAAGIAQRQHLVEQRRRPQMRIINEPGRQIPDERGQRVRAAAGPPPRHPLPGQVGTNGLRVSAQVTGDRRDRPPPLPQSMYFHVFSLCEHELGAPLIDGRNTVSSRGPRPVMADLAHDPPRATQLGKFSDRD
jgi:hypothetical protein